MNVGYLCKYLRDWGTSSSFVRQEALALFGWERLKYFF
jgi:hypothetical protein